MASTDAPSAEYLAESKTTLLNALYSIPIPLELTSTLLRLWVRTRSTSLAFDDYLMIWATITSIGVCVCGLVYGPPYGLGRHLAAVPLEHVKMLLLGDYIFSHFYNMAIACTKLSVLALYYHVFEKPKLRIAIIATFAFVVAWIIVMEVVLGFGCRPIRAWWHGTDGDFTCVNKVAFTFFTNITNLTTDIWIFAMPIPTILGLNVARDKRISLLFLFSIGFGTCAISAARLTFIVGVGAEDFTWTMASLGIMSAWEPCGGILCANLPMVYRSLKDIFRTVKATVQSSKNTAGASGLSERHSQTALSNDWKRLHNTDNLATYESQTTWDISSSMTSTVVPDYEMRPMMRSHHTLATSKDSLRPY
ncbi:hypothetical protein EDB80DRAFT_869534 [Ilyonectria destructans]|nr:hypothetical protein EDB80DRAFT_869534 [Ilyonectria destructans]